jgi:hypothetical protein
MFGSMKNGNLTVTNTGIQADIGVLLPTEAIHTDKAIGGSTIMMEKGG